MTGARADVPDGTTDRATGGAHGRGEPAGQGEPARRGRSSSGQRARALPRAARAFPGKARIAVRAAERIACGV